MSQANLEERIRTANAFFQTQGIGFTVYGDDAGTDRIFPFDLIPRIVPADEWDARSSTASRSGCGRSTSSSTTSTTAQRILAEGVVPPSSCFGSRNFRREMIGFDVPGGIYAHVGGVDLVRDHDGPLPRARGQPPHAVGRQLHARQPPGAEADLRDALRPLRRAPDRPLPARCCTTRSRSVAPAGRDPSSSLLTPGPVQLGLLRALLPGAADGRRDRRGTRPRRAPQPRLHPHDPRASSRST